MENENDIRPEVKPTPYKELFSIKPLKWKDYLYPSGVLHSSDAKADDLCYYVIHNLPEYPTYYRGECIGNSFNSIDEAKAAANKHYHGRLLTCLIKEV